MAAFYKELKKLRENSNIQLEEIQNRTKINIRFLEAFENGQFDILPHTYVRLFFRAYVTEIGGDPVQGLSDLEHFINRDPASSQTVPTPTGDESPGGDLSAAFKPKSPMMKRSNLIKAGIMIVFWVFALLIIRRITLNSDGTATTVQGQRIITDHLITENELLTDYVVFNSMELTHDATPPFSLRISGKNIVSYKVNVDSSEPQSITMPGGDTKSFLFSSQVALLLNHSRGVAVFLNGNPLKNFISQDYPVRILITGAPPLIQYKYYTPFQ
ncbi:MAG: helix-turn-helix domain-containing protein [FCB group bacterium]|nr:helix-turn-helix domain-containing protein [FCB group bacterium]